MNQKITKIISAVFALFVIFFIYHSLFGAPQKEAEMETFVVALGQPLAQTIQKLKSEGFIKSRLGFLIAFRESNIAPGGYKISKAMNVWKIARALSAEPYMKWVVIPEGLRKEQIAAILAQELGWNEEVQKEWVQKHTARKPEEKEGVYFPNTYLIPKDEEPAKVAERLRAKFNEAFAPYLAEATKQNIKWTTLLKLASLVQKEAGKNDMPLIAGILWNRLLKGMKLEVDATLQYIKGTKNDWWPKIMPEDKKINSPYNTYLYKGLPPTPIANPGLEAIKAALFPEKTDCLFYIHDNGGEIHCAKTYAEHLKNIETYLKK
jgi:UPF0755 protein